MFSESCPDGTMISLRGVSKRYRQNSESEITALHDVAIDIHRGEWLYVVGGNGSGKSTLLKVIWGQERPDAGSITFAGGVSPWMFFVESGTRGDLVPSMTVYENLVMTNPGKRRVPPFSRYRRSATADAFRAVLAKFGIGLEGRLHEQVGGMSGGQQQAVVAAKVLLSGASLILLDEFTSALDKKTAPIILSTLREHSRTSGVTVVAVTHDYHWIPQTADRVAIMESGSIREILRSRSPLAAEAAGQSTVPVSSGPETTVERLSSELIMERLYGRG